MQVLFLFFSVFGNKHGEIGDLGPKILHRKRKPTGALDTPQGEESGARDNNAKKIILGCTHYPYLENIFKNILNVEYFNPAICLSELVKDEIGQDKEGDCAEMKFYVSKQPNEFVLSAKTFFDVKEVELIEFC